MSQKRFGSLSSSTDPSKLGATVQAIMLGLAGVIVFFANKSGFPIVEADIVEVAGQVGMAVSVLWALYGVIRKIVVRVSENQG